MFSGRDRNQLITNTWSFSSFLNNLERVKEASPLSQIILGNKIKKITEAALSVPTRMLLVHHLRRRPDSDVHPHRVQACDGDPGLVAVQGALVPPVAQHLKLIPDVDLGPPSTSVGGSRRSAGLAWGRRSRSGAAGLAPAAAAGSCWRPWFAFLRSPPITLFVSSWSAST